MSSQEITPKYDSTLGLIFRLNNLWAKVDIPAEEGDYNSWNNILDRIYNNLAYRHKTNIKKDDFGNIISMEIDDEDDKQYKFLSKQVNMCKQKWSRAVGMTKGLSNKSIARSNWYKMLNTKDIWLRRFMQSLHLYIKETTKSPGAAMWGGKH